MKCKDCQLEKRIHAKDLCITCYGKHSMRKYRTLHLEEDKQRKRNWYLNNKEKVAFYRKRSRILKHYNMTLDELENMKKLQNDECLICSKQVPLKVDHDHKTGRVRGLLCDLCNRGLGYFRDNPELLVEAAEYLISSRKEREVVKYGSAH
jgi:hypothetical protein